MASITIYTSPTCHYCHAAKDFFNANNVAFTEKNVAGDQAAIAEVVAKSGQLGVPVIDIDGAIIIGFDEQKIKEALKIA